MDASIHFPPALETHLIWATRMRNPVQRPKPHYRPGITIWHLETGSVEIKSASRHDRFQAPIGLILGAGWCAHKFAPESLLTSISIRVLSNTGPVFALPTVFPIEVKHLPRTAPELVRYYSEWTEPRDSASYALFQLRLHKALASLCFDLGNIVARELKQPFVQPIKHAGLRQSILWWRAQPMAERITEPELARQGGMSVSHFKRVFQKEMGMSLREYLRRTKADACVEALLHTDKSIKEIGFELGFSEPANFVRWFRQQFNITPGGYRESH